MTALHEPAHLLTARRELFIYRAGLVAQLAAVDAVAVDLDRLIESLASPPCSVGEAVPAPLTAVAAVVESTPPQGEGTAPGTPNIVESSASPERGDAVPEFGRADGAAPATRRPLKPPKRTPDPCPRCGYHHRHPGSQALHNKACAKKADWHSPAETTVVAAALLDAPVEEGWRRGSVQPPAAVEPPVEVDLTVRPDTSSGLFTPAVLAWVSARYVALVADGTSHSRSCEMIANELSTSIAAIVSLVNRCRERGLLEAA